ncbi:MAG: hypothetical protein ABII00_05205 [Elusimicrobiota bacterium]
MITPTPLRGGLRSVVSVFLTSILAFALVSSQAHGGQRGSASEELRGREVQETYEDNSPLARVAESLDLDDQGQCDRVAERLMEFAWPESGRKKSFVSEEARKHPDVRAVDFLQAVKGWVESNQAQAKVIYYVLGPGDIAPGRYLVREEDRQDERLRDFEAKLADCLDPWAGGSSETRPEDCFKAKQPSEQQPRPLESNKEDSWVKAFFTDAFAEANALLFPLDLDKEVAEDIGRNDRPDIVLGGTSPADVPGDGGAAPSEVFGAGELFAELNRDRNAFQLGGRNFALVIRTVPTFEGEDGERRLVMKDQVGLYDISKKTDIYGRRFDLNNFDEQKFSLKAGGFTYTLKLVPGENDTRIEFSREGEKIIFGVDGQDRLPSVNELYQIRAKKALESGNEVEMGGKRYKVTGEASTTGKLLFWDKEKLEKASRAIKGGGPGLDARDWRPEMAAEVNEMRDARPVNLEGPRYMGKVGDDWYALKWNAADGVFEPVNMGKKEPAATEIKSAATTEDGSGGRAGDDKGSSEKKGGADGNPVDADGFPRLSDYTPDHKDAAALNEQLSPELKNKIRFYGNAKFEEGGARGKERILAVVESEGKKALENQVFPFHLGRGVEKVWIAQKRYLVTQGEEGYRYYDLSTFGARLNSLAQSSTAAGYCDASNGQAAIGVGFSKEQGGGRKSDEDVLKLALADAGYADSVTTIIKSLRDAAKSHDGDNNWIVEGWAASGAKTRPPAGKPWLVARFGADVIGLYPKDFAGRNDVEWKGASAAPKAKGKDGSYSGVTEPERRQEKLQAFHGFGETHPIDEERTGVKETEITGEHAALYKYEKDGKTSWYLALRVWAQDLAKARLHEPFLAFQDPYDLKYPLPKKDPRGIRGLDLNGKFPDNLQFHWKPWKGENLKDAGYIAAYSAPKGKDENCVGVVAWWGVEKDDVCKACGADWIPAKWWGWTGAGKCSW